MYASSLIEVVRCHLGAAGAAPRRRRVASREVLEARLTDPRKPRGIRHSLGSLVSVLVAGVACGYSGPLAIAGAAAGWDQEVLAAHGTRRNPVTGAHEPPSASTLGRLPALLDADELEAALSALAGGRRRWTRSWRPGSAARRGGHEERRRDEEAAPQAAGRRGAAPDQGRWQGAGRSRPPVAGSGRHR